MSFILIESPEGSGDAYGTVEVSVRVVVPPVVSYSLLFIRVRPAGVVQRDQMRATCARQDAAAESKKTQKEREESLEQRDTSDEKQRELKISDQIENKKKKRK